jgi:DNA-binding CsgD family transcriptional regulator
MYRQDDVLRLVGLIYEAALDGSRWQTVLEALAELVDAQALTFWSIAHADNPRPVQFTRLDPAFFRVYPNDAAPDPWMAPAVARNFFRPGIVALGEELVPATSLTKTPFYNEIGKRFGVIGGFGLVFGYDATVGGLFGNQRRLGQFGEAERTLFQTLAPHIERAIAMKRQLSRAQAERRELGDVLERVATAVLLVDRHAVLTFVNGAGAALLRTGDGLLSTTRGLTASVGTETRALRDMVAACALTSDGDGVYPGGTLRVSRRSGQPLHLMVAPFRLELGSTLDRRASAVVFVHDPDASTTLDDAVLRHLYGFTAAEARVARLLGGGQTLAEIQDTLQLSSNTVRSHLKRLFEKTGTRTQSQLVHALLAGLARLTR